MTTAFQTGPGFFAAMSHSHDKSVPLGFLRVFCARIEAYDLPKGSEVMDKIEFTVLFAMAEEDPRIAQALLYLGETIAGNRKALEEIAKKS